jgi:uncharacterized protein (DUF2062 family)
MPFFVYVQYTIGSLILGRGVPEISTTNLIEVLKHAPVPFLVGTFPAAAALAIIAYPLTLVLWDYTHSRLGNRGKVEQEKVGADRN